MITILLPTHRPNFFKKALYSLIKYKKTSKTISQLIINCDDKTSKDNCKYVKKYFYLIKKYFPDFEIYYISTKNDSINKIYYNLIQKTKTEYFYFLEDDDMLLNDFNFLEDSKKYSYFFGLYIINDKHENVTNSAIINSVQSIKKIFKVKPEDIPLFQLGQVLFKTKNIKWFPTEEHTYNDFYLVKNNPGSIKHIYQYFFKQGWSEDSYSQNFLKNKIKESNEN